MTPFYDRLAAIRQEFPAVERTAYLNTGSVGPLPRRTAQATAAEVERQLLGGRASYKRYVEEYFPLLNTLRARFARLLGAGEDEIALTHHTTEGMNIAVWGIPWQPGDEIVTTTAEHEGGFMPVYAAARRFGLNLRVVDIGPGAGDDMAGRVIAAISSRTRLVAVSHVLWKTGAVLPLAEIAEAAHRVGAWLAVDGAQSVGAIPAATRVRELDVDSYTVSGHKWLCGPEGTGALYVRRERVSELSPTFVGYLSLDSGVNGHPIADQSGYFIPAPGAHRYEVSTVYPPTLFGLNEGLRWLEEDVGYEWVFAQRQAITQRCREILAEIPGVTLHTPGNTSGLTTFSVAGLEPMATSNALGDMGIVIRWVHEPERLRVSTAFFNNDDDLMRLREGLLTLHDSTRPPT
jgi:L-cysteine/cystine lyase